MTDTAVNLVGDCRRKELHNGRIVAMAGHSVSHGRVFLSLARIFENLLKGHKCEVVPDGISLFLSDKDEFFPDLMIVCNPEIIKHDGVHGAPDLVVEILSPSTKRYDRGHKKNMYERHGVKEYWLIDTNDRSVEIYVLVHGQFEYLDTYVVFDGKGLSRLVTETERNNMPTTFAPSIFPDFSISVADIFASLT